MENKRVKVLWKMKIEFIFVFLCTSIAITVLVYSPKLVSSKKPKAQQLELQLEHDVFDVHIEGGMLEGSDDTAVVSRGTGHHHDSSQSNITDIAIGCAITTRDQEFLTLETLPYRLPFLKTLLPSFCKTASEGFHYHFYIAFDLQDPFLNREEYLRAVHRRFIELSRQLCSYHSQYSLHFVQCNHNRYPTWAQNDAMMEAYLDNVNYFYRVNDDTEFLTPSWTEELITGLQNFDPPLIGVVGPMHVGGNTDILTYDFVHKTHIDIFGYYYPRLFTDWWADNWISSIYGEVRTQKIPSVRLIHTMEAGTRYQVQYDISTVVKYQIKEDQATLTKYIASRQLNQPPTKEEKVISMSLWGTDPRYTFGALRNAQLVSVYFPGWRLRVYVEKPGYSGTTKHPKVPERILTKLELLGTELMYVDYQQSRIPPMMWRFLVADDTNIDYFIVRDADGRLSERDAVFVNEWIQSGKAFHCVRDHPNHSGYSILGGMWGGRPAKLQQLIHIKLQDLMMGYGSDYAMDMTFLNNALWPRVQGSMFCHDSVSCRSWPASHAVSVERVGTEHLGQVFDAFGNARDNDVKTLAEHTEVRECVKVQTNSTGTAKDRYMGLLFKETDSTGKMEKSILNNTPSQFHTTSPSLNVNTPKKSTSQIVWSIDFDIGPMRDIQDILSSTDINFLSHSLSYLCLITRTCAKDIRVVTRTNGISLGGHLVEKFYAEYEHDAVMNLVTHFLCTNPVSICELYMKFGKPIIVYVTHRYERGRYTTERWFSWNQNLQKIASSPENTIAANNEFDARYVEYFTGIRPRVVPSICRYVNTHYRPSNNTILVQPLTNPTFHHAFFSAIMSEMKKNNSYRFIELKPIDEAYPTGPAFHDLSSHPAILHIPQHVSTMELCQHYAMSIPLLVPSLHLLIKWHLQFDLLSAVTYNSVRSLMGDDTYPQPYDKTSPNPNNITDSDSLQYWMKFADFYQMPHVIYFESVSDLLMKLLTVNMGAISDEMSQYSRKQRRQIGREWHLILNGV